MKAQALGDTSSLEFMRGRRILEINPDHPIVKDLNVRLLNHPPIFYQRLVTQTTDVVNVWKLFVCLWDGIIIYRLREDFIYTVKKVEY